MKITNGLLLLFAVVLTFSGCSNSSTQSRTETNPAELVSKTDYERMVSDLGKIDSSFSNKGEDGKRYFEISDHP